ncbi:ABHD11 protein [Nymphaea thermarum]|nr:ABHD11 protein [Nymphaea thermarum]
MMVNLLLRIARSNQRFSLLWGSGGGVGRGLSTLAYEVVETTAPSSAPIAATTSTAFILHGLMGSGRNWRTFSRQLASSLVSPSSAWKIVLVDLRNHGKSVGVQGLEPPHDMKNSARDLANLINAHKWPSPDVVIGHSMGGKVALEFLASCARGDYGESVVLPKQLWVLDSVPHEVNLDNNDLEVEKVLHTLQSLSTPLPSRRQKDYWPLLEKPPKGTDIMIVRAERSDRWTPEVIQKLESLTSKGAEEASKGRVLYHVLPDAGHWVHVDNPKGLLDIMIPHMKSLTFRSFKISTLSN